MSCHAAHTRGATNEKSKRKRCGHIPGRGASASMSQTTLARPAPTTETNKGVGPTREQGEDAPHTPLTTPLTTVAGHPPPGDGPPPPPRPAAPTRHAGQGDSAGPPHPHTRAHSTWVADPNSPPSGRAVGGGGALDLRRPSQRWKAAPPGTPFHHPHSEQRRPTRGTLWGRCWVPTPAPTAPGTHGSRNPGYPRQRTGGLGRDSA